MRRQKKYNGQMCWEKYMEWGAAASHIRLRRWLISQGVEIEEKGMGSFFSMWRYAIFNPEATFPQYKKWYFETASSSLDENFNPVNPNVSYEDYLQVLKKHGKIRSLLSRNEYKRFCEKYNLDTN